MLSKKEREFIRDYLSLMNPPFESGTEEAQKDNQFREKWSYDYERVIWHRVKKKYPEIVRDLMLLEEVISRYERGEIFYNYMLNEKTRSDEEEAQRLITFFYNIQGINEEKKEGKND